MRGKDALHANGRSAGAGRFQERSALHETSSIVLWTGLLRAGCRTGASTGWLTPPRAKWLLPFPFCGGPASMRAGHWRVNAG